MEGEGGHGSDETHELCNGTTITMLLVKIDINSTSVRFKDESFKWDVGLRTSITGQNIRQSFDKDVIQKSEYNQYK